MWRNTTMTRSQTALHIFCVTESSQRILVMIRHKFNEYTSMNTCNDKARIECSRRQHTFTRFLTLGIHVEPFSNAVYSLNVNL